MKPAGIDIGCRQVWDQILNILSSPMMPFDPLPGDGNDTGLSASDGTEMTFSVPCDVLGFLLP